MNLLDEEQSVMMPKPSWWKGVMVRAVMIYSVIPKKILFTVLFFAVWGSISFISTMIGLCIDHLWFAYAVMGSVLSYLTFILIKKYGSKRRRKKTA
jgi:hypothetical protein